MLLLPCRDSKSQFLVLREVPEQQKVYPLPAAFEPSGPLRAVPLVKVTLSLCNRMKAELMRKLLAMKWVGNGQQMGFVLKCL
jgi:hypothetical protein